jgi:hypothetical protein
MVVQTQERYPGHSRTVGLHIGSINVQQYFPRDIADIELELDHLCIVCPLEPSFWQDRPEIHDFRLSSWLESKRNSGKLAANPASVALIPSGDRAYRLQLIKADEIKVDEMDSSLSGMTVTGIIGAAYLPPAERIPAPVDTQDRRDQDRPDRRSRNSARTPDRRRVARLRSDDSPSPSVSH